MLPDASFAPLVDLLHGRRVAVLTGAGCSTESGIPDYRGAGRPTRRSPVTYQQFTRDAAWRARYWARSYAGWPGLRAARPNAAHHALARLARVGALSGLITQNVDRLHQAAGHPDVVELHGALAEVLCLGCGAVTDRDALQRRLTALNPAADVAGASAPDGDAEVESFADFRVPDCESCGGLLKPRVVFFGESVPPPRVERSFAMVDASDALLVVGSSLTVYSGYRFVRRAVERGLPVGIVNQGPTRGDADATVRVEGAAGEILKALADHQGA